MIPPKGQRFKVSFTKMKYTFDAVIIGQSKKLYEIKTFNRVLPDPNTGWPNTLPETTIEVEKQWFDTELTGRIITPYNEQLELL